LASTCMGTMHVLRRPDAIAAQPTDMPLCMQLFLHMCDNGVSADAVTCCSLINAMDKAGMWPAAELVLLAMGAACPSLEALRSLPPEHFSHLSADEAELIETLSQRLAVRPAVIGAPASDCSAPL
jgi:hypothetical protein